MRKRQDGGERRKGTGRAYARPALTKHGNIRLLTLDAVGGSSLPLAPASAIDVA